MFFEYINVERKVNVFIFLRREEEREIKMKIGLTITFHHTLRIL